MTGGDADEANVDDAAARDSTASTPDRPTSDRPTSDGPTSDGPTSDRPTSDRPTSDGLTSDRPTPDPRVRDARPTDADRIRDLQQALRQPSPELLEYGLAIGSVLVSVAGRPAVASGNRIVGYLLPVDAAERPGIHLAELVVSPEFRREGRARGLLWAAVDDADGPVTLQAHPDNDAALALYDEVGFEVVDRREDAYDDADGLILRRD